MTEPKSGGHSAVGMLAMDLAEKADAAPLALEALYDAHFEDVWRVLRRLGVREATLDDAVQDVFLVVHRRLADFERRSTTKTWIMGIAIRVAKDHRRLVARKGNLEPLPEELADTSSASALDLVQKAEAARFLDRFLETLDEDKREAFVLAELEQLSAREIAELSGANINTIYSRLRVARERFEEAIAGRRAEEERNR